MATFLFLKESSEFYQYEEQQGGIWSFFVVFIPHLADTNPYFSPSSENTCFLMLWWFLPIMKTKTPFLFSQESAEYLCHYEEEVELKGTTRLFLSKIFFHVSESGKKSSKRSTTTEDI